MTVVLARVRVGTPPPPLAVWGVAKPAEW